MVILVEAPPFTWQISEELAVAMYRKMAVLQSMDLVFYDAQRQGRFSFYMTTAGEEAINIASAAAISDLDTIFAQVGTCTLCGHRFRKGLNRQRET